MGLETIKASQDAEDAQEYAADKAQSTQEGMYGTQRADAQPWMQAGQEALKQMQDPSFQKSFTMADFTADPGYQFRMDEGQKALQRSAAAKGGLMGGATLKAITNYGQNAASAEYQSAYDRFNNDATTRYNRLASLAGVGQTATNQIGQTGMNMANQVSGLQMGVGNAQAASSMAQGKAVGDTAKDAGSIFAMCDQRLKTDIEPVSKEDLAEMRACLKAFRWRYKNENHGKGIHIGVMAQDLEKSKLGRSCVFHDNAGNKQVDIARVMMIFLATEAEG